jgi:hypothetical protein
MQITKFQNINYYVWKCSQVFRSHVSVCVDLEVLWGPSCCVMFSTPSKVETWFDYSRNTTVIFKKTTKNL